MSVQVLESNEILVVGTAVSCRPSAGLLVSEDGLWCWRFIADGWRIALRAGSRSCRGLVVGSEAVNVEDRADARVCRAQVQLIHMRTGAGHNLERSRPAGLKLGVRVLKARYGQVIRRESDEIARFVERLALSGYAGGALNAALLVSHKLLAG